MSERKSKVVSISLSLNLLKRIKIEVERLTEEEERRVSISEIVAKALTSYFPKHRKDSKNGK